MSQRVRVWDLPTRLFHWALLACVVGLVVTAKVGGNAMVWHFRLGHMVLALLLFRLTWGLVGGHWSRFTSFLHSPGDAWSYLRGRGQPELSIGHSPTGAVSVFALLAVLLLQVVSGLSSDDEIAFAGPLTSFLPGDVVSQATRYHKDWGQWLVLGLIALHITAVLYYVWARKQALIRPMVDGDKTLAVPATASRDDAGMRLRALLILALCSAVAYGVSILGA